MFLEEGTNSTLRVANHNRNTACHGHIAATQWPQDLPAALGMVWLEDYARLRMADNDVVTAKQAWFDSASYVEGDRFGIQVVDAEFYGYITAKHELTMGDAAHRGSMGAIRSELWPECGATLGPQLDWELDLDNPGTSTSLENTKEALLDDNHWTEVMTNGHATQGLTVDFGTPTPVASLKIGAGAALNYRYYLNGQYIQYVVHAAVMHGYHPLSPSLTTRGLRSNALWQVLG